MVQFKKLLMATAFVTLEVTAIHLPRKQSFGLARDPRLYRGKQETRASWELISRGGDSSVETPVQSSASTSSAGLSVADMFVSAISGLQDYMKGAKSDTLLLLLTTALVTPVCKRLAMSPILGFLATGILLGPNGKNVIKDIHTTEMLADIGIVFFLFEMGIHLNFDTLMKMRKDVFGLGLSQFVVTAIAVAAVAGYCGLSTAAMVVLGGGLALSSSAFVLQLLKDKDQLGTQFGRSSFGVLLLQDLMVVPLLVVTPILAGGGGGLADAIGSAVVKASVALASIAFAGRFLVNPFFDNVAKAASQEAFLGIILFTVLGMSFLTEGLGLSNTLGAFLAGVLLSDTKHRHKIETEISPFRGILVSLFFFSVGFEIDLKYIASKITLVAPIVIGLMGLKAIIATGVSLAFGLKFSIAQQVGFILSQGGEFAFVAFRMARGFDILDKDIYKLMMNCVSLTMGLTPFVEEFGAKMAKKLEDSKPEAPKVTGGNKQARIKNKKVAKKDK
mmetsp:Transcript_1768/g.2473  ORF Transcript_1768/g.2473 Transcript_1768/m.2473 type:complete len:503 (-) Transcript_1768:1383-2891(-)